MTIAPNPNPQTSGAVAFWASRFRSNLLLVTSACLATIPDEVTGHRLVLLSKKWQSWRLIL